MLYRTERYGRLWLLDYRDPDGDRIRVIGSPSLLRAELRRLRSGGYRRCRSGGDR